MINLNKNKIIILIFIISFCINLYFIIERDIKNGNNIIKTNNYLNNKIYKIGTLEITDTDFKKTLVQTNNNSFFLSHDINGNLSNIGSVFLDYRNQIEDKKLLIYGHNSKTIKEAPFHFLENYLDFDFGMNYNKLVLKTTNKIYYYQLFTVIIVNDDLQHINLNWSIDGYKKHFAWLKEKSIFNYNIDISDNDSIIIFQTCYYQPNNSYLLVGWKRIS